MSSSVVRSGGCGAVVIKVWVRGRMCGAKGAGGWMRDEIFATKCV
jgi:hypothetical protein